MLVRIFLQWNPTVTITYFFKSSVSLSLGLIQSEFCALSPVFMLVFSKSILFSGFKSDSSMSMSGMSSTPSRSASGSSSSASEFTVFVSEFAPSSSSSWHGHDAFVPVNYVYSEIYIYWLLQVTVSYALNSFENIKEF